MRPDRMQMVNRYMKAWNAHDVDRLITFYATDYQGEDVIEPQPQRGRPAVRRNIQRYLTAFPDLHITWDKVVADGEQVALTWTAHGTHQGRIMNIPPTGKEVVCRGATMLTIDEQQIVCARTIWDVAGFLRSIGLLPRL